MIPDLVYDTTCMSYTCKFSSLITLLLCVLNQFCKTLCNARSANQRFSDLLLSDKTVISLPPLLMPAYPHPAPSPHPARSPSLYSCFFLYKFHFIHFGLRNLGWWWVMFGRSEHKRGSHRHPDSQWMWDLIQQQCSFTEQYCCTDPVYHVTLNYWYETILM